MHEVENLPVDASIEVVAYRLLLHVMEAEGRPLVGANAADGKVSRNVILDAYADCLDAVRGMRQKRTPRAA
jgi:hypothetical protein